MVGLIQKSELNGLVLEVVEERRKSERERGAAQK
jgi:hypothetical protein